MYIQYIVNKSTDLNLPIFHYWKRVKLFFSPYFVLSGDLFTTDLNPRWRRPPAPALNPSTDTLVFQQIDLDYYLGKL